MEDYSELKNISDIADLVSEGDLINISATQGYECIQLFVDKYTFLVEIVLVNVGSFNYSRTANPGIISPEQGFIHSMIIEVPNSTEKLTKLSVDMDSQLVVLYERGLYRTLDYSDYLPWSIDNPNSNNPDNNPEWLTKSVSSNGVFK